MDTPSKRERSGPPVYQIKAETISFQHLVQKPKALKRIRTEVDREQTSPSDHSTIGTLEIDKKWSYIYNLNRMPVKWNLSSDRDIAEAASNLFDYLHKSG